MEWLPMASAEAVKLAWAPEAVGLRTAMPRTVAPSRKATVPLGAAPLETVTAAVNVTDEANCDVSDDEDRVVALLSC